jgi:multidrug resistance efflux pump
MKESEAKTVNLLPVLPKPFGRRLHDLRIRLVPSLALLVVVGAALYLWRQGVASLSLIGQVEAVEANVASLKPGVLAEVSLAPFQPVRAGDPIARVVTTDPQVLAASLAVIQAEIDLLRTNMQPALGLQRNGINYDQLRVESLRDRTRLATARVNLQLAETEFHRTEELYKDQIVSERVFEQAKSNLERNRTEVEEFIKLVAQQETSLKGLFLEGVSPTSTEPVPTSSGAVQAAVEVQERKLRLTEAELGPVTIKAPVDGMVSAVLHHSGETVMAGQSIATIRTPRADRILAYLREPVSAELKVGTAVRIMTRSSPHETARSTILQVGVQMEAITNAVLRRPGLSVAEVGLPIEVSVPSTLKVRPGELVDLALIPAGR